MKKCKKCGIEKEFDCFYKHSGNSDGRLGTCIPCVSANNHSRRLLDPEAAREVKRKWRSENKERRRATEFKWRSENEEHVKVLSAAYYQKNREKYITACSKNNLKRRRADLNCRLAHSLRTRLNKAINRGYRSGSAVQDLGCSIPELRLHLERQFQPGMTWDNWSVHGWHIDHVLPLDSFTLSEPEQLKKACHYTNLQPLWARDNLVKSNKLIEEAANG